MTIQSKSDYCKWLTWQKKTKINVAIEDDNQSWVSQVIKWRRLIKAVENEYTIYRGKLVEQLCNYGTNSIELANHSPLKKLI